MFICKSFKEWLKYNILAFYSKILGCNEYITVSLKLVIWEKFKCINLESAIKAFIKTLFASLHHGSTL